MGEVSRISWTDSTFNGWTGCIRVSPGCEFCYAERDSKRNPQLFGVWGPPPKGRRVLLGDSNWKKPLAWDKKAAQTGKRHLVFAFSLADVFEEWTGPIHDHKGERLYTYVDVNASAIDGSVGATMDDCRLKFLDLIRKTPHLTWLLLTKRPENVMPMLERCLGLTNPDSTIHEELAVWLDAWISVKPPENVWMGTTAENQEWADKRLDELLKIPAKLHWVSYEPALGPVDWSKWLPYRNDCRYFDGVESLPTTEKTYPRTPKIGWLICGGESGTHARSFHTDWARDTVRQCRDAGIPAFVKQIGDHPFFNDAERWGGYSDKRYSRHGADPSEWPSDIAVQEFPA